MSSDVWPEVRLGDHADLLTGYPFRSDEFADDSSGLRLLRGDNVAQGRLRWDGAKLWPSDRVIGFDEYLLEAGDVVLAMDRPWIEAGLKFAVVSPDDCPCILVQRVARLRGANGLDTAYLRYVIGDRDFTDYILGVQTGTAVPHISGRQIGDYRFRLPPLAVQRRIARVLGALDAKIELNRRMSQTLESTARAIFQLWFGNREHLSEAPGIETRPRHVTSIPAMPGWTEQPLGEFIELVYGKTLRSGERHGGDVGVYGSNGRVGWHDEALEPGPGIVVGRKGSAGVVTWVSEAFFPIDTTFYVRPRRLGDDLYYAYFLLRSLGLTELCGDSAVPGLNRETAYSLVVRIPSTDASLRFAQIVRPILTRMAITSAESRSLADLRDVLIPLLLTGGLGLGSSLMPLSKG